MPCEPILLEIVNEVFDNFVTLEGDAFPLQPKI
jgi:hypothetical protein